MTDIHLRQLVPLDLRMFLDDDAKDVVYLPGEISVKGAMEIEAIRGDKWAAEFEREQADSREAEAAARALVAKAYEDGRDKIVALARSHPDNLPELVDELGESLTETQIETILSVIVAPPARHTLMAKAYALALGLDEGDIDPLAGGSSPNSSASGDSEDSAARTGTTSRGASGSRSAPTRSPRSGKTRTTKK